MINTTVVNGKDDWKHYGGKYIYCTSELVNVVVDLLLAQGPIDLLMENATDDEIYAAYKLLVWWGVPWTDSSQLETRIEVINKSVRDGTVPRKNLRFPTLVWEVS